MTHVHIIQIYLAIKPPSLLLYPSAIYLSIYPSVFLCIYLSIYLSIKLSIYLYIYTSIYTSIYLYIYSSIYPSIYISSYPNLSLGQFEYELSHAIRLPAWNGYNEDARK